VRDEHVKDAAQDVAEDVTQDAAGGVLGAAEGGLSSASGGTHVKDEHAKDAAQFRRALRGACHRTWRRTWASGPGRRAPSSPRHHRRRRRRSASRAETGAQLGSSVWHLARAVGGCRAKRSYVY